MSFQYDQYLARHRANVKRGFDWLSENLPGLMTNTLTAGWNTEFSHDQSKNEPDEYEAYDAYFYGNNRSYEVVQRYQRAWLLHIHRNLQIRLRFLFWESPTKENALFWTKKYTATLNWIRH